MIIFFAYDYVVMLGYPRGMLQHLLMLLDNLFLLGITVLLGISGSE